MVEFASTSTGLCRQCGLSLSWIKPMKLIVSYDDFELDPGGRLGLRES